MLNEKSEFPDVLRPDSGIALVWPLYVATTERQDVESSSIMERFDDATRSSGFKSVSIFASTDGENLLTYAQWADDASYRQFEPTLRGTLLGLSQPIRYVPYRSVSGLYPEPPTVLVAPTFDVDGLDRQKASVDSLIDGPLSKPIPGLVASHFHLSLDGSRVLNWAEWVDDDAHDAFMRTSRPAEFLDAITMPGVRGIGGKRYRPLAHR